MWVAGAEPVCIRAPITLGVLREGLVAAHENYCKKITRKITNNKKKGKKVQFSLMISNITFYLVSIKQRRWEDSIRNRVGILFILMGRNDLTRVGELLKSRGSAS